MCSVNLVSVHDIFSKKQFTLPNSYISSNMDSDTSDTKFSSNFGTTSKVSERTLSPK